METNTPPTSSAELEFTLHSVRERMSHPLPPALGPDGYTRLIAAAWQCRTEEDRQRYLKDEHNRPVAAWFRLDGSKDKR